MARKFQMVHNRGRERTLGGGQDLRDVVAGDGGLVIMEDERGEDDGELRLLGFSDSERHGE